MFSGGAFQRVSIFALGIVPYINSSIVFSLLAVIIPKIEEIQKEGESGRNKITQWTRYLTIVIAIVQGIGVCTWLQSVGLVTTPGFTFFLSTITTLTAGTIFLMWVGEQIPVHYVGRGFAGNNGMGQNSYIPLKLNSSGVMPVIFASVVMMIPSLVVNMLPGEFSGKVILARIFGDQHPVYLILYAAVIIFFSFFYTSIVFDPEKVAENLKQGGGTIPSIRPGADTADYLEGVVTRITWGGAIFLALIAIAPMVLFKAFGLPIFFGGTGIIIVVGVALDTVQQIDAHLIMKEYKGFL